MSNTSNLQKTGMQMLLGRERFEGLIKEADRVGLSMATVVRQAIDAWMSQPDVERQYEGELNRRTPRVVNVAASEAAAKGAAAQAETPRGRVHPRPFG